MKGIVNLLLVIFLLASIPLASAEVSIEITSPSDGDLCNGEGNELYISGIVRDIQENSTIAAFFKAEWDETETCWYPGMPIILVPLVEDGNWSCYITMEPEEVTGPWINITAIVLDGGTSIESGRGYTGEEITAFAMASHNVMCKRCTEPNIEIVSPVDGQNVGFDSTNIPIEGSQNLDDPEVTLWLAGYTETNANVWPLGDCQKNSDRTFSGIAHPGNCDVTCGATDITIYVFALRPPGVEIWNESTYMTPEEFDEFLGNMSCVEDSVTVYRSCTEPTPVPALSWTGIFVLIALLCVVGAVCMKRK
ncbi:MAG: hypothetical protein DRN71_01895 [Candidatus Nanohalarchaeota archaeon]|nr:MAG: hypothetical protein DRN71_01895 [Candidatus Nanohaloarchaeota archaeon]